MRDKGVLIIGSGNMVHNLGMVAWDRLNDSYAFDWAKEASDKMERAITTGDHAPLINFHAQGKAFDLAINSGEHYLPLLYTLALQNYHFVNSLPNLDITNAELTEAEIPKTVATSFTQALEEWMRGRQNQGRKVEGRLAYGE